MPSNAPLTKPVPLPITELVARVGADRIQIQNLMTAIVGASRRKNGLTEVRFLTNGISPATLLGEPRTQAAVILWMDQADFCRVVEEWNKEHEQA